MEVPVFVFTGFIDSGKTTLMRDTIESPDFAAYRNLIIMCEDGDEEYSPEFLKKNHAFLVEVSSPEELTDAFLADLAKKYTPDQVMIEYNGTWTMTSILNRRLPRGWEFYGIYSTVDTATADGYLNNMRQMFMEQFSQSGLIIFNRCDESVDRPRLRRIFKAFNPGAQVIFERPDGEMYDPADEPLPYDINADVIEVDDLDYGVWYIDAMDHPERYMNKKIRFLAQVYRGKDLPAGTFVPGRFIMTCCANDIRFMGYMCSYPDAFAYKQRDWVRVTVSFDHKFIKEYGEKAPFLSLVDITPAEKAEQDPVYLN